MRSQTRVSGRAGCLPENIVGALAYFSFVPAIIFLLLEPYRKNRYVRFHSLQCLVSSGATILLAVALKLAGDALFLIPVVGPLLVVLVGVVASLAVLMIWLVLVVKAVQGEMFKLPILGYFAEQHADAI
jgi:uncharacterized membrane protein